jgi:hypothetical protein
MPPDAPLWESHLLPRRKTCTSRIAHEIVTTILRDLDRLENGAALKVPLAELAQSKEKVRSALNRSTRRAGRNVATASDAKFLYVWNVAD